MTIPILNGNSLSQNGILIAIAVTLVVAVGGAVLAPTPESTATILGLCAIVVTNLVTMLRNEVVAAKQDVKVEEVKTALAASDRNSSAILTNIATAGEKAAAKIDDAAAKVDDVKTALVESNKVTAAALGDIAATGVDTHTLVNSNYGIALLAVVTTLEEFLDETRDPKKQKVIKDRLAIAQEKYDEHQARQAVVDSGTSTS